MFIRTKWDFLTPGFVIVKICESSVLGHADVDNIHVTGERHHTIFTSNSISCPSLNNGFPEDLVLRNERFDQEDSFILTCFNR